MSVLVLLHGKSKNMSIWVDWVIAVIISHTKLTFAPTIFRQIVLKVNRGYRINFINDHSVKEKLNKGTIAATLNLGEHQRSTSSILKM